jgi:hypothetical protein
MLAVWGTCGVLLCAGAYAGEEQAKAKDCANAPTGLSLCGKSGGTLHACVRSKSCDKQAAQKKRGKGGLGFLSRLFI